MTAYRQKVTARTCAWLLVTLCMATTAQGDDHGKRPWHLPWPALHCGCCPDQYCPKPLPHVAGLKWCGCGEKYCPKPLPGMPCLPPGCGVCYDVKPLPCPPPCSEPWYRCAPGAQGGCAHRLLAPLMPADEPDFNKR